MKTLLLQQYLNERHKPLASVPCPRAGPGRTVPRTTRVLRTGPDRHRRACQPEGTIACRLAPRAIARGAIAQAIDKLSDSNSCRCWMACGTAASMAAGSGNWDCMPLWLGNISRSWLPPIGCAWPGF